MICAIHQPNYLPYQGFFDKIARSDVFIIYDTTQFRKNSFQNRNRVCSPGGWQWLTVPVKHCFGQVIKDVEINNPKKALKNNWEKIKTLYGKAPFFKRYAANFEYIYNSEYSNLSDLNYDLIITSCKSLGLNPELITSSSLKHSGSKKTEALIELCRNVGADTYLSGKSGKSYLDTRLIENSGIKLIFQDFEPKIYKQFNNDVFQPNMSIIDLIFNYGDKALKVLSSNGKKL